MGDAVVSGSDSAEVLETPEHTLDGITVTIEVGREAVLPASIDLGWHFGGGTLAFDLAANCAAVIPLVAVQDRGRGHLVEQGVGGNTVRHVAAGQHECRGAAEAIGQRVDFRGSPTARAADRLAEFPPLPPEAQR